ncbi:MAG: ornithine carbamoyltransferase [Oscillospiraceae bacterium]|nr:ornithine carbamoyltransferase [Oscillospiraceae bacterium]MDD4367796.1 ornithine carbamoyltransferase [Oscillospiraceae bacterium]
MKDFLRLYDYSRSQLEAILDLADQLKADRQAGREHPLLKGQSLGMIFAKSSTRTRVSFEVGMYQLGGEALFLSSNDIQLGRGETIADTARVMSRYLDGIMIRTFSHSDVVELARYASIPVINGLTDLHHPCQVMADLQTIREEKGHLEGLKLAYVGDGNNMANSLLEGCAVCGINIQVATPVNYKPDPQVLEDARQAAKLNGSAVSWSESADEAIADADVIYTDTWVSMGQESEKQERVRVFRDYQVNRERMKLARPDAIFLHCLPAYRGYEVSEEVFEGPQSRVFDEAENRLHAQKAIMVSLMNPEYALLK